MKAGFARQSQLVTASENGDHENTKERKHETEIRTLFSWFRSFVFS
jgi:hypothetical protein